MASCNMCRNGKTGLGRPCPNGCKPDADLVARLREDAGILRYRGGFPTIANELDEAADEIARLRSLTGEAASA